MKTVFYNGPIITMEDEIYADWIICEGCLIVKVGYGAVPQIENADYKNLDGKTLMPAFIDAHSHFTAVANNFLQLSVEGEKDIKGILEKIKDYIHINKIERGQWVKISGYESGHLFENRNITCFELDTVSKDNPIVIQHASGHMGIFNSMALSMLKIDENTSSSENGVIEKKDGVLTGYMEEQDFVRYLQQVPMPDMDMLLHAYDKAQEKYLSYGITIVQEGMMTKPLLPLYQALLSTEKLKIKVIGYADLNNYYDFSNALPVNNNFKLGGVKIFLDGSPQGRTAWMKTSYQNDKSYYGYPILKDCDVLKAVEFSAKENIQLLAHCNGDMACEQFLNALQSSPVFLDRPVMIHAQFLALDQFDTVKAVKVIPSFFVGHVYYWGDTHINNFGMQRASMISPAKTAQDKGVIFTFHQDSPVTEPNMLHSVWCSVVRQTANGITLGEEQKIDVFAALKAVTIHAAYQYFEEDKRGSIKEGKYADLIILDKNPLSIPFDEIKDITVLQTIKEGNVLFSRI